MNKLLPLTLILAACGPEYIYVKDNSPQVTDLEEKAELSDSFNQVQTSLIEANSLSLDALEARVAALEAGQLSLSSLIANETAARQAGDLDLAQDLANEIALRLAGDSLLQGQLDALTSNLSSLGSSLSLLQSQVSNNSNDISSIQSSLSSIQLDILNLQTSLSSNVGNLQGQIDDLSDRIDSEGVVVYACKRPDTSLSKERFLKISGTYYGVMNYVTVGSVTTVTGSSSVNIPVPLLCKHNNANNLNIRTPNSGGSCPNNYSPMADTGVTHSIPAYTTASTPVVTSVQMALEGLISGSGYVTTDNSTPCYFNGDGTNLQAL